MHADEQILSAGDWRHKVLERDKHKCASCNSDEAEVYFLTPRSLGGRTAVTNGISLCQMCRLDSSGGKEFKKIRLNVPLSKEFQRDLNMLSMAVGRSVSDIAREVVAEAVFMDKWSKLPMIPTNGSPPERTNIWFAKPVWEKFESWCKTREMTVPTAIRSLLWGWAQEIQKGV